MHKNRSNRKVLLSERNLRGILFLDTVRGMKQFALLVFLICLSACLFQERKQEVFMTDSDYAEFERRFSPDSSMLLLNYGIDLGATGYGQEGTAILKTQDTSKNLRLFTWLILHQ